jgi:hypothetical protein
MKRVKSVPDYVVDLLQREDWQKPNQPYIKPSSLAKGCLLYVAFELRDIQTAMDPSAASAVGTDSHRRLQRPSRLPHAGVYLLSRISHPWFVDGVLYIPPDNTPDPSFAGLGVGVQRPRLESDKVKAAKQPKKNTFEAKFVVGHGDLFRRADPAQGAIIYYENAIRLTM